MRTAAEKLAALWGDQTVIHFENADAGPREAGLLRLDSPKARRNLN